MRQQETLMPLQTLRTCDPDELAEGFRRWDLHFRQFGGGSFRGELDFLQLGGTWILRASGNRRLQAQGCVPPGSFGFAPVLPSNAGAVWRGRRCQTGQVITIDPGQEGHHMSAADYWMVGLTVDGEFFRECAAVLGGFDPDERLVGRLAITSSPACCRALTTHLEEWLDRVAARPDLLAQPRTPARSGFCPGSVTARLPPVRPSPPTAGSSPTDVAGSGA
jgi:hypothetical protein